MSYSRFSEDCDVYTFYNSDGYWECCGCQLGSGAKTNSWQETADGLISHLAEHTAAGHKVPDSAIEALKADADSWEDDNA